METVPVCVLRSFILLSLAQRAWPLKCFEEGPSQSLSIVSCAFFAFGNTQVCYTIRQGSSPLSSSRGCQYIAQLGVQLGPAKNLTEELTCAWREPSNSKESEVADATFVEAGGEMVEVCACSQDLCNTQSEATIVLPTLLMALENAAPSSNLALPLGPLLYYSFVYTTVTTE